MHPYLHINKKQHTLGRFKTEIALFFEKNSKARVQGYANRKLHCNYIKSTSLCD